MRVPSVSVWVSQTLAKARTHPVAKIALGLVCMGSGNVR